MIIKSLLALVSSLISVIPFSLPTLGNDFQNIIKSVQGMLETSISFVFTYFVDFTTVSIIFGLLITWLTAKLLYKFAMWVIRKIPMLNIRD